LRPVGITLGLNSSEKTSRTTTLRTKMASTDSVSFKVYLKCNSNDVDDEVKRFVVDRDVSTSFAYLQEKLVTLFPAILRTNTFQLGWTDEDGDKVTIGSDEELILALTQMEGPTYKIECSVKEKKKCVEDDSNASGETHPNVSCDACDKGVRGFRYKCVVCPDYDLCGGCEAKGQHSHHNMIRISNPEIVWPKHFFNKLNRMHDRMHKRTESASCRRGGGEEEDLTSPEDLANGGWVRGMNGGRGLDLVDRWDRMEILADLLAVLDPLPLPISDNQDPMADQDFTEDREDPSPDRLGWESTSSIT
jgi:hypothetical protein